MPISQSPVSNPFDFPGSEPAAPPPQRVRQRHALGLPAGSVRALLAFMVLGTLWCLVLFTKDEQIPVAYVYLQYVMILILAHYFAAHGNSISPGQSPEGSPLGLPRGSVRFLLLAGFLGLVAWLFYHPRAVEAPPAAPLVLPLVLGSGFFLGFLVTRLVRAVSRGGLPFWFQDIEAWVALLAMLGLGVILLVRIFINRDLAEDIKLDLTHVETGVAAVVGFYFGARS